MSYGIKVRAEEIDAVESFCENKNIAYQIFNAGEFFFGDDEEAEVEFELKAHRDAVHEFVINLRSLEIQ